MIDDFGEGVPELHFGFEQVKPPWLIALGAVALLANRKTVSGGRTFGKTDVHLPLMHKDSLAQANLFLTSCSVSTSLSTCLPACLLGRWHELAGAAMQQVVPFTISSFDPSLNCRGRPVSRSAEAAKDFCSLSIS